MNRQVAKGYPLKNCAEIERARKHFKHLVVNQPPPDAPTVDVSGQKFGHSDFLAYVDNFILAHFSRAVNIKNHIYDVFWGVSSIKRANLRIARWKLGLTQAEVAQRMNVDQAAVSNWENGITFPQRKYQKPLEDLFGEPFEVLFGINDDKEGENK